MSTPKKTPKKKRFTTSRKPSTRERSRSQINIRFTEAERVAWTERAMGEGVSLSFWIRQQLDAAAGLPAPTSRSVAA